MNEDLLGSVGVATTSQLSALLLGWIAQVTLTVYILLEVLVSERATVIAITDEDTNKQTALDKVY